MQKPIPPDQSSTCLPQSTGLALSRSSSIRVRQKYSAARNANNPRTSNVPVRSFTFALKTRIGSSERVVQAKMPSAAYAINASANFFLIVNTNSMFQGFKNLSARDLLWNPCNLETFFLSLLWCTGEDSNLRTS